MKATKAQAHYHHPARGDKHCSACTMWRPPSGCTAVQGHIYADGVCDYFKRAAKASNITQDHPTMSSPYTENIRPFRPAAAPTFKIDGADVKRGGIVELEDKALTETDDCWVVTGLAAAFGNKDRGGDVIVEGAFSKTLREEGLPLILFQHKMDDAPVGTCLEAKETSRGLWIKAALPKDDVFVAGRLIPQLKRRGLKGMSIGYKPVVTERRKSDNARLLKEIRLFECSFVSLPMNPAAGVETVKADAPDGDVRDAIRMLRETFQALSAEAVKLSCDLAMTKAAVASALSSADRYLPSTLYMPSSFRSGSTAAPKMTTTNDLTASLADIVRLARGLR